MRVVHIATNDVMGGASRAAYRIHRGLRSLGQDSLMYVMHKGSDDPAVVRFVPAEGVMDRLHRRLRERRISGEFAAYAARRPAGFDLFTDDRTPFGPEWFRQLPPADLLHLHWVGGFLDYNQFFARVPRSVPVVWRLADMNPFTGGCHFDHGCGRFLSGCGACPQLGSTDTNDLSHAIWRRKKDCFARLDARQLHIVVLNKGMIQNIQSSPLLGRFAVSVVPNGLDTDVFAPREQGSARAILGIPADARVLLFAADDLQNRRKGLEFVIAALPELRRVPKLFLLSVGGGRPELPCDVAQKHLGRIRDDLLLSVVYSAADVFVFPSLQETFGQTALESMACGTPVVGFEGVGGVPELLRGGETGRAVPKGDVNALAQGLVQLLKDASTRSAMTQSCRRMVLNNFNLKIQAERFQQLYQRLLSGSDFDAKPD